MSNEQSLFAMVSGCAFAKLVRRAQSSACDSIEDMGSRVKLKNSNSRAKHEYQLPCPKGGEHVCSTRVWNSHHLRLPSNPLTRCVCVVYLDRCHWRLHEPGRFGLFEPDLR